MSHATEMYQLLQVIAVFSTDKNYAKQAEELVRKIEGSKR